MEAIFGSVMVLILMISHHNSVMSQLKDAQGERRGIMERLKKIEAELEKRNPN